MNVNVRTIAELPSSSGCILRIAHAADGHLSTLVEAGAVDAVVMAAEHGFSPLGFEDKYLTDALGFADGEIKELANGIRFESRDVALVALRSRRPGSRLKGLVLAPGETSLSYERFAMPLYGRPSRDFYYNVAFEAQAYAAAHWGAENLGMSHLSASGRFHSDIAVCAAEAAMHCRQAQTNLRSLVFFGCCIDAKSLAPVGQLCSESSTHRPVPLTIQTTGHVDRIRLNFEPASSQVTAAP